ncbi:MAG: folylpolyglutamate synthase [Peptococcaceae bacterium BICA1-7]|nr:MAG: folylpolyglutamate synthase [Peptococcaceae bacterium BICA1-7]HBV97316.1 bifunctional folylpolyglutamate synthase/dihydrofolate synthase [Desulfotomaculum sp.]
MKYSDAILYMQNLTKFGFNFGLGRITELLRRFGSPHLNLRIIHVGGTNGKGSTTAIIHSILRESGYRVGTYTSPHLHAYTERYCINGRQIPEEALADIISELKPHLEDMVANGFEHPTEFEVGTALAFIYFSREKVDFLVLEVGLGGAIDSTNVVVPMVSVITNVAMDHMEYLGSTVEEIAAVKSGIIKKGVPLVTAAAGEALGVIMRKAEEMGSAVTIVGRDIRWQGLGHQTGGQYLDISGKRGEYKNLFLPLMGSHQQVNAATAVAAVEVLADLGSIGPDFTVRKGVFSTDWPARLEIVKESPIVIIDAAHNYDGAVSLRKALDDYFPGKRTILVMGMLGDKERAKVMARLAPGTDAVIVTKPNSPRAGDWQMLAEEAEKHVSRVEVIQNIPDAVWAGIGMAGPEDLVVITGSFYMVAEAREVIMAGK